MYKSLEKLDATTNCGKNSPFPTGVLGTSQVEIHVAPF